MLKDVIKKAEDAPFMTLGANDELTGAELCVWGGVCT